MQRVMSCSTGKAPRVNGYHSDIILFSQGDLSLARAMLYDPWTLQN